jgi:ABC-type lipopolysaccharide export system ATPase subunit
MTVATPALVAEGITSGYGEVPVVQDVSIHVAQNEIVTLETRHINLAEGAATPVATPTA